MDLYRIVSSGHQMRKNLQVGLMFLVVAFAIILAALVEWSALGPILFTGELVLALMFAVIGIFWARKP